jgi:hypothetical protein
LIIIAKECSKLEKLNVTENFNITDLSLIEIAKKCKHLKILEISFYDDYGMEITDNIIVQIRKIVNFWKI